ncbi:hypothetical protein J8273_4262 [Carpediemonas membranifera]|uniref:Homeobox domain-containing protein n=1 Tax=Carpediemonas membranifera TaxID=201153 RepID=A0A8J6AWD0_9EUKA|nr:hypothetical protein J8273_4262 [Carpediemonas membranifera]|eukprot:KAG9394160.1 hypothetical protein J8273_4262 [Carpediemonas membranifera]
MESSIPQCTQDNTQVAAVSDAKVFGSLPPIVNFGDATTQPAKPVPPIQKKKHKRVVTGKRGVAFSPYQISVLVHCFQEQSYPSRDEFDNLARYIGLDTDRVRGWFQNSRTRGVPSKAKVNEVSIPAQAIMDGLATRGTIMPLPDHPVVGLPRVRTSDKSCQCTNLPLDVQDLYFTGAFDELLER